ncbi:Receptor-like kinase [Quillaja saponaria]|uniref:Receptor-like serine/threonine-protein kinase n=1 Tax=Quillaja saponaria TaxID=32244 RepID=A0AAD7KVX3_QUISA|nr:Receptor-like kinase [Quillaja saponaria]
MEVLLAKGLLNPLFLLLLFLAFNYYCNCLDTITPKQPIKDGDVLVSQGANLALGFFSPGNSTKRYVGIWYHKVSEQTVVWVANRDSPLNDKSGVLFINTQGILVLNGKNQSTSSPIWSTKVSVPSNTTTMAKLLDTGNFVLVQNDYSQKVLWESFDYPTDTMLPFMKLGLNRKTGLNRSMSAWKSPVDPGTGTCSYSIDPNGYPQLFLYKEGKTLWRTGSWTGQKWSGVPEMSSDYIFNVSFVNNASEISVMYGLTDNSVFSKMMLDEMGFVRWSTWQNNDKRWIEFWYAPKDICDDYERCGANSNCDPYSADKFECTCLPGFEPRSPRDWYLRDGSGGCDRKNGASSICRSGEGFVMLARLKVPSTSKARVDMNLSLKSCNEKCLRDCSCTAYASANESTGGGCMTWHGDLLDTRTYAHAGQDLYIRVDKAELAKYSKNDSLGKTWKLTILIVSSALVLLLTVFFIYWIMMRKRHGSLIERSRDRRLSFSIESASTYFQNSESIEDLEGSRRSSDLPLFDLSSTLAATDNFSYANKLGEGGFGSVYKGVLQNGMAIAIKRLSKYSGQGIEEFRNEIALIAKLQHRNLVRILGCCIEEEEKMLIYEYLPNKSLDSFIFDETKKSMLGWSKRLEIIYGVARGILYLHRDSRLRIIHRDLKASNVLLDSAMNPKIADFGMARIFGTDQIEANTNRVVGTYGYMSPEYAMEGLFSVKSDVYSFGVLILEIITGRRNSGYYKDSSSLNLVGHVWETWKEGKVMKIVDPLLTAETCSAHEVLRCIQIGLLCVQDYAADRPTMSTVVSMLVNDSTLPSPKQPAFIFRRSSAYNSSDPSTSTGGVNSVNGVTVTMVEPR